MIRHIVMLRLPPDHDTAELRDIMQGLKGLQASQPGMTGFEHGQNLDFENKLPDYPYGFICSFTDPEAVQAYAADPTHKELGQRLVALCGGSAGILVIDLNV